jgi:hypothetical protein
MPTRRAALLLPLLATACGGRSDAVPPPLGPLGFRHLTPLPLNVAVLEFAQVPPRTFPGDIGAEISPSPAEAVRIMARDRLSAAGTAGQAVFTVTTASLVRDRSSLTCLLGCRLEILDAAGNRLGFAEAEVRRSMTGPDATRPRAADLLLRRAMDDLNVEFEFQLRRNLRDWLATAAPGTGDEAVSREDLPET